MTTVTTAMSSLLSPLKSPRKTAELPDVEVVTANTGFEAPLPLPKSPGAVRAVHDDNIQLPISVDVARFDRKGIAS